MSNINPTITTNRFHMETFLDKLIPSVSMLGLFTKVIRSILKVDDGGWFDIYTDTVAIYGTFMSFDMTIDIINHEYTHRILFAEHDSSTSRKYDQIAESVETWIGIQSGGNIT